jgi:hypothetical protein
LQTRRNIAAGGRSAKAEETLALGERLRGIEGIPIPKRSYPRATGSRPGRDVQRPGGRGRRERRTKAANIPATQAGMRASELSTGSGDVQSTARMSRTATIWSAAFAKTPPLLAPPSSIHAMR